MLETLAHILADVGRLLLDFRGQAAGVLPSAHGELKTRADQAAHDRLSAALQRLSPQTPVLSEEAPDGLQARRPQRYWLIDPVDGTASLLGGFAGFVTQAALIEHGRLRYAGVYAPVLDLMYLAENGKGATCNGRRLTVRPGDDFTSLIDNYPEPRGAALALMREFRISRYIESGSLGLKICRVADGSADLFFKDVVVRDWDLAAPALVLAEAGGILSDQHGAAIPYAGGFERSGLIAAPSATQSALVADWNRRRTKG